VLLGIGWSPLLIADLLLRWWPAANSNYAIAAFGMWWLPDVSVPSTLLTGLSIMIQLVRLAYWEMRQGEPRD
jgi:hypothetical protein